MSSEKFTIEISNISTPKMSDDEILSLKRPEILKSLWAGDLKLGFGDECIELIETEILWFFYNMFQLYAFFSLFEKRVSFPTSDFDTELEFVKAGNNIYIYHVDAVTKSVIEKFSVKRSDFERSFAKSYLDVINKTLDFYPNIQLNPEFASLFPAQIFTPN